MRIARALLWLWLITFAAVGLTSAFFPHFIAALVEISLPTDTARVDFMATYGGLELGLAGFLWTCTRKDEHVRLGLLASGWALSGFALTRLLGILNSKAVQPILYLLLLTELMSAAFSFWAARRAQLNS